MYGSGANPENQSFDSEAEEGYLRSDRIGIKVIVAIHGSYLDT